MRIAVIGANGFVGSAFLRHFRAAGYDVVPITRKNYTEHIGATNDVVIDAAGNSRKFWAEEKPLDEFDASVAHRFRTLHHFPARLHVHISSVDVYDDLTSPASTGEVDGRLGHASHYGFHKYLAEQLVQHYAERWLILRLAGMLGPGLRKNPVFDILNGRPLRIHPDSNYQFMLTDDVARIAAELITAGASAEIFNVCGSGLISPREVAALSGRPLNTSELPANAAPRVVYINIDKISARQPMPATRESVGSFIDQFGRTS